MRHRKTREWLQAFGGFENTTGAIYDGYVRAFRGWLKTTGGRGNGLPPNLTPETARLHARINRRGRIHEDGQYHSHWHHYKRFRSLFDAKYALVVTLID